MGKTSWHALQPSTQGLTRDRYLRPEEQLQDGRTIHAQLPSVRASYPPVEPSRDEHVADNVSNRDRWKSDFVCDEFIRRHDAMGLQDQILGQPKCHTESAADEFALNNSA
jgi:hypothetical protein